MPQTIRGYPATSDRSRGWLRYLHRKATTPDNWDKNGRPHPHWDALTGEPTSSWHRFDLLDSSYAMALMADTTPAWREVYSRVLDELAYRHTGYWAAKDWLDQIGHDPRRQYYPEGWHEIMPAHLIGNYDVPGWTANGVQPWGLQMDPIAADGNLFFKGWFLVILGLYLYVSGDEKWNQPFDMVRDGDNTFTWTHTGIVNHLVDLWSNRAEGCH